MSNYHVAAKPANYTTVSFKKTKCKLTQGLFPLPQGMPVLCTLAPLWQRVLILC